MTWISQLSVCEALSSLDPIQEDTLLMSSYHSFWVCLPFQFFFFLRICWISWHFTALDQNESSPHTVQYIRDTEMVCLLKKVFAIFSIHHLSLHVLFLTFVVVSGQVQYTAPSKQPHISSQSCSLSSVHFHRHSRLKEMLTRCYLRLRSYYFLLLYS